MKILSLLFSLLLGAAVLLFFLQPLDRLEKMFGDTAKREAAPAKPSGAGEETAAVETAPPKRPEAAARPPASSAGRGAQGSGSQAKSAGKRKG